MSLTATGTAVADGQDAPGKAPAVLNAVANPSRTQPVTVPPGENCKPTAAGSHERRAGAVRACVAMSAEPVTPSGRQALATAPAAAPAADSGSCEITTRGQWWYGRFGYCVYGITVLYTLRDSNGKPVGTGTLNVSSSSILPAKGTQWKEKVSVTMTDATGAVTALNVRFRGACSAGCKATTSAPWYGKGDNMIKGKAISGDLAYASTPAAGTSVDFTTSYEMFVTAPGVQITDPNASWSNPKKIRCDDAVRDTTTAGAPDPGCVVPSVMPIVRMSDQQNPQGAGAAAAGYLWAQNNLPDGWGLNKPLTRAKSGAADRAARTCGTFQARTDLVATDSCAGFPFAAAHEGGTDGAQCAELLPRLSARGWVVDVLDGSTSSPCARAHVPLADHQAAERQLSEGFTNQRVVENDQFTVEIGGSIAEPYAVCRQSTPAGAFTSGNGWIKNTTEPVLHVNKTTTPPGPPGTRASAAQACLGTLSGKGSDAKGNITGWADADLFRQANSSTAGLARCHLIANVLGGTGAVEDGGQINLVPCWQQGMNTGTPSMRTYETLAQNSMKPVAKGGILGPNDAIFYQVTPDYRNSDSTIPQGVTMTARVERSDGTSQPLFPDIYIANTYKDTGLLNLGN
ncbi:DNA/RNA non-specific endonuclease [Streptomyces venezuelae]|uniref:DNA/RNA non-specific endonuclease n=1 Tax=Streptomyces venezuelae TaxID=54571 RepID=UPI003330AD3A